MYTINRLTRLNRHIEQLQTKLMLQFNSGKPVTNHNLKVNFSDLGINRLTKTTKTQLTNHLNQYGFYNIKIDPATRLVTATTNLHHAVLMTDASPITRDTSLPLTDHTSA